MKATHLRFCASRVLQLGCCHTAQLEPFGFSVLRFALLIPAAKIERDSHAGGSQFVRKGAVDHGTSHDHASDGQGSYALPCGAATPSTLD